MINKTKQAIQNVSAMLDILRSSEQTTRVLRKAAVTIQEQNKVISEQNEYIKALKIELDRLRAEKESMKSMSKDALWEYVHGPRH